HTEEPNSILISNGFCSMGFALPGAIGAKLACPDRRVLAICGDGGVLMNIQDLETAVREKLNIVVMVWTDSQYGLIKWKQQTQFGRYSHIDFTNPDFMKLADAFHMVGFRVERTEDLASTLEKAFAAGRPVLVEVPVDYAENMKLTQALNEIPFERLCSWLDKAPLFREIPEQYRRVVAEQMREARFKKGETVFERGDPSDTVYVVHSGRASVRRGGKEIASVGPGEEFGEMAAITAEPRLATVVATEDLVCGTLDGEEFRELVRAEPEIAIHLARVFSQRLASS
ncbi:MAG: cyclic nucleotide-binding domain-containing protein, partial [Planctomycetota bacterium]